MILHVDMDAFYASVEQRDRPELMGKPVVVGGSAEGRGVVCAASYEARKYGVHSAMPAATAHRLCPQAVFLSPRMSYYAQISEKIRDIFHRFTPQVEPLSLDEAFLDVTGSRRLFGSAVEIGRLIKQSIREELQLVASVGVAPNKFLAKLASDLRKPDGFVVVDADQIQDFLDPLPISRLWGVGAVTQKAILRLGIRTMGQFRQLPPDVLKEQFGEQGLHLWRLSQGIDQRRVVSDRESKSISHESTFAHDLTDPLIMRGWLVDLTEQVAWRLRRSGLRGRTVHLKLRFGDFRTITRAHSLARATNVTQEIWETVEQLFARCELNDQSCVRLLGVGMSQFDHSDCDQPMLFDESLHQRLQQLDRAADQIRARFGSGSLGRASGRPHRTEE